MLAPILLEKMVPDASKPEGNRGSLTPWDVPSILLIVLICLTDVEFLSVAPV
jgi:hypothetical protein